MRTPLAFAGDLLAVTLFALIGRASHHEALSFSSVLFTGWPFLIALGVGWLIASLTSSNPTSIRGGVLIWLVTLSAGMALRVGLGGTTAGAFILVAGISLAVLLLGWRLGWALLRRSA